MTEHVGQRIVDLMGNARSQRAESYGAVVLDSVCLQESNFGDVVGKSGYANDLSGSVTQRRQPSVVDRFVDLNGVREGLTCETPAYISGNRWVVVIKLEQIPADKFAR